MGVRHSSYSLLFSPHSKPSKQASKQPNKTNKVLIFMPGVLTIGKLQFYMGQNAQMTEVPKSPDLGMGSFTSGQCV